MSESSIVNIDRLLTSSGVGVVRVEDQADILGSFKVNQHNFEVRSARSVVGAFKFDWFQALGVSLEFSMTHQVIARVSNRKINRAGTISAVGVGSQGDDVGNKCGFGFDGGHRDADNEEREENRRIHLVVNVRDYL